MSHQLDHKPKEIQYISEIKTFVILISFTNYLVGTMFHLRQLQCALALAKHQHFGRAADEVGITQSGLTQSIARLEGHYGVALFSRERKSVMPTAFGEIVLHGAVQVLERVAAMDREVKLLDNLETGHLVIGVDPMLATSLLAPALAALLKTHPQLRFSVRSGGWSSLATELLSHEIDLFVGFADHQTLPQVSTTELKLPAPVVVAAPDHPLMTMRRRSLSDFLTYPLVQGPVAQWYLDWAEGQLGRDKLSMDLLEPYFLHADDTGLLLAIAKQSHALLAAMREDVQGVLDAGELVEIKPPRWPGSVSAVLAWANDAPMAPAAERLVDELVKSVTTDRGL